MKAGREAFILLFILWKIGEDKKKCQVFMKNNIVVSAVVECDLES